MDIQGWFHLFIQQILATSWLEWLAVGFGVAEVLLAKRNKVLLYPMGIISILLWMYLYLGAKLYAEMALNVYYLVMSIYGWMVWKSRTITGVIQISWTNKKELMTALAISAVGFVVLFLVLKHFTDSDVPYMDAFVSATAWAGMWLLARRKIENWIFLNISNIVAVPLLIHKQLAMGAVLTAFLFTVAIFGYLDWKRIAKGKKLEDGKENLKS